MQIFVNVILPQDINGDATNLGDKFSTDEVIRRKADWKIVKKGGVPKKRIVLYIDVVLENKKGAAQMTSENICG